MLKDEKLKKLSKTIVFHSLNVKKGDNVNISFPVEARDLVSFLIEEISLVGANAYLDMYDSCLDSLLSKYMNESRVSVLRRKREVDVSCYDKFIQIRYNYNDYENKDRNDLVFKKIKKELRDINEVRINERDWVLLNYPSNLDAFSNKMPYRDFYDFSLDVMSCDYEKMNNDMVVLKELMERTDRVRIVGPSTDLSFSIKGLPAIICSGEKNLPDGEVYTAPVKDSVNGVITYNTPSPYDGMVYHDVSLTFKDGKIINAVCSDDNEMLNKIFDTDSGSRYVGEFSFGLNPKILYPMGDILYDEKIKGSIHFTPGCCYDDCNNGNKSVVHWDLVLIQREDFGGGEVYFDDVLIRKDGKFVLDGLKHLNYE